MSNWFLQAALIRWRTILNVSGFRNKKVFAIGFNKCGTTSIHELFLALGRPSYHGEDWLTYRSPNLLKVYDCFSDGFPVKTFSELDTLYPCARFVLQVRDLESWLCSRLSHVEREKAEEKNSYRDPRWDNTDFAVKYWITERNEHHLNVLKYFLNRPKDLLIINYIRDPDAGTKLANHLGHKGTFSKPKENVSTCPEIRNRYVTMIKRCAEEMGIPEIELGNDIYCASIADVKDASHFPVDTAFL